ncbi:hypothetical protein V6N13_144065 [Hibiscus sabdariffa]|uniref:Mannose-P-dolichol utilization defect 1 protein homolog n=1 Tax=Hibiscus sabdariffa TaxID=183260 RepID=A0ABR2FJ91_9ROSI
MDYLGIDLSCAIGSLKNGSFPPQDCLLPLISKLLGYAIVAASTTVKLPQIMKILKHRSVRGLSLAAFELEVVGYTIALAYCLHTGLPFSAYGELVFLLIQAIILVAIIYYFSQPLGISTWGRALLFCAIAPTVLAGRIDPFLFEALYASQHAIFFFARVPQIWKNFSNKSTGELSFLTCLMNTAGSLVRVFTSIQEKAPPSVVAGSVLVPQPPLWRLLCFSKASRCSGFGCNRLSVEIVSSPRRPLCTAADSTEHQEEVSSAEKGSLVLTVRDPAKYHRFDDPDYRKWKDKEEEILLDIEPIISLVKEILHSNRYMDGGHLTVSDQKTVLEKLLRHHPHSEDKIGCGFDSIMVDRHPQFRHSRWRWFGGVVLRLQAIGLMSPNKVKARLSVVDSQIGALFVPL